MHQLFHNFASLFVVIALSASANQFNINIRFLDIPTSFAPNGLDRTQWIVDPLSKNDGWTIILAIIPAIFLALTIYIEQQLCGRQINNHYALLKVSKEIFRNHYHSLQRLAFQYDLVLIIFGLQIV